MFIPNIISARTTPADIVNSRRDEYNLRVSKYSESSKNKLNEFDKKISDLNRLATEEYENQMLRQGQILDEYLRRKGLLERQGDGIQRNLQDPVENARYWITYAHEAVAFQAAKAYIYNLTGESNLSRDINSQISALQSDLNILRGKVLKSQKLVSELVKK